MDRKETKKIEERYKELECQTMSELIDRQDVIDRLKKAEDVFRQNGAKLEANGIHYALELVESDIEIPAVDEKKLIFIMARQNGKLAMMLNALRPPGKWLIEGGTTLHFCCSECGGAGDNWDKFCKHCGAKMNKEAGDDK